MLVLLALGVTGQDYQFSYNTDGAGPASMFREERRLADGERGSLTNYNAITANIREPI